MVVNREDRSAVVVGIVVLAAAAAFVLLLAATTNRTLSQRRAELWVELPTADGLRRGDALLFRGVQVGEVKRIEFGANGAVVVRAMLVRRVPLTTDARARLVAADVFGRQSLVLDAVDGGRDLASGDTLRGVAPPSLTGRIEGMAARVERVVGDTTVDAVHALLAQSLAAASALEAALRTAGTAIAAQQQPVGGLIGEHTAVAANLRVATDSAELIALRATASSALGRLDQVTARLDTASTLMLAVLTRMEAGEGSLGLLANDTALYARTVGTLGSLERLISDVRENPRRYINVRVF
jgi:phospholipid/cholesterol/gamma-HCH transport system substrate-binding protein